jgi:cytochrome c-type biogenesis protein CcmH/NrfF
LVKPSKEMSAEGAISAGSIKCGWRMPGNTARRVALSCGIIVLAFGAAVAALADRPLTAEEQQRANHLYTPFVAPCCWRQSVAVHQSAQGMHVRNEIDQDVIAGKIDSTIKAELIREYGRGILMDPEGMRGLLAVVGWLDDGEVRARYVSAGGTFPAAAVVPRRRVDPPWTAKTVNGSQIKLCRLIRQ